METALIAYLLADTPLSALVSTRVSWVNRPQAEGFPAIVLQLISGVPEYTHSGLEGLQASRVQVDCWATTFLSAKALADAVITRTTAPFTTGSVHFQALFVDLIRDTFDGEGPQKLYRRQLDLSIWHNPT